MFLIIASTHLIPLKSQGQFAGPSIAGAILSAASGDWKVVALYSGAIMLLGSACILYGKFGQGSLSVA